MHTWGSSKRARQRHSVQENLSETSHGMWTMFQEHGFQKHNDSNVKPRHTSLSTLLSWTPWTSDHSTSIRAEACAVSCWWNRLGTRWIPRWLWHPWKGVTKHAKGEHNSSKIAAECHLKSKGVCYREFESLGFAWSTREPFRLSLAWCNKKISSSVCQKKTLELGPG